MSEQEKAAAPTNTSLRGLSNQIHAVNDALERALAILYGGIPDDNKLAEAIEEVEMAREMTSKLDLALFAATIPTESGGQPPPGLFG